MGLIEIRLEGELAAVGELRNHESSDGPVLVLTAGEVPGASAGDALTQGEVRDCELRVRDPRELGRVRQWASSLPVESVALAWGGARGGGRKRGDRVTVARKITLEREVWRELRDALPAESWSARVAAVVESFLRSRS